MLVQITPVATGKGSQPAAVAEGPKKHGDGISGRANGAAPICRCSSAVANHVTSREKVPECGAAASSAVPSTSKSVTGQSFGAKSRSGSLDQLLFLTDQLAAQTIQRQENRHTGRREITADDLFNYLKDINGDLKFVDKKKLAQLLLQNTETIVAQQHPHLQQLPPQQSATGTIRKHAPASRQESTGEAKQIHFVNHVGPTPPPSMPVDAPTKGILQTRKSISGSKFGKLDGTDNVQQQREFSDEWLNRSHFQRTSSRSVEVSTMPKQDESTKKHHKHHQRHFSGPEDLEALKKDITHWLERLPYKKDAALLDLIETAAKLKQQNHQPTGAKPKSIIKNEFADIVRPPLPQKQRQQPPPLPLKQFQRQKSADDLRVLKNNILEWLTKQQIMNQHRLLQQQQQQMVPLKSAIVDTKPSDTKSTAAPPPLPRKTHQKLHKRHSLGPSDTSSDFHEVPDWIQIPIDKLNKMRGVQKSCVDMTRKGSGKEKLHEKIHHRSAERKLRHSASEVVQSTIDRNYQKHNQQLAQPQQLSNQVQYQLIQHQPAPSSMSHQLPQHFQPKQQQEPQVQYQVVQRYREPTVKSEKSQHHSHHGHHGHGHAGASGGSGTERTSKRDKPRHRQTQRSATTGNILQNKHPQQTQQPAPEVKPIYQSTTSLVRDPMLVRCDDPMCPLLPICTDPNCYLNANSHYDTPRRASLPQHPNEMPQNDICTDPRCCEMLPLCTDPRCCGTIARSKSKANGVSGQHKFKSNSLPRCVESTRRSDLFLPGLTKDESYSSLPKSATLSSATAQVNQHQQQVQKAKAKVHNRNGNNKLMKSASAASLHSRRRRHKTVHFGENLLREVCQNRQLIRPLTDQPSNSSTPSLQPNIQMLYNFVEGVMSAWVDEDDDNIKSGPDSEPERGAVLKPMHRCNRARMQTIRRVVNEAASLKGTLKLGNSRYRHRHWRGTAKDCNERFLRKVILNVF